MDWGFSSLFAKTQEDDPNLPGIGINWLWQLPNSHPFYQAALAHDAAYEHKTTSTSKPADDIFLRACLDASGDNLILKAQAYLFYSLARAWGVIRWKRKLSKSLFIRR